MSNNNNGRRLEVSSAQSAMDKLKVEVAQELGIPNYDKIDKGMLPARIHGYIGGNIVRKMIKGYEAALANGGTIPATTSVTGSDQKDLSEDRQKVKDTLQKVGDVSGIDIISMVSEGSTAH
jgi:hypothetical protein